MLENMPHNSIGKNAELKPAPKPATGTAGRCHCGHVKAKHTGGGCLGQVPVGENGVRGCGCNRFRPTPASAGARDEALRELAEACLAYDRAIESCADNPAKMASFCSAQGDDLDTLYFRWRDLAKAGLALLAAAPAEGRALANEVEDRFFWRTDPDDADEHTIKHADVQAVLKLAAAVLRPSSQPRPGGEARETENRIIRDAQDKLCEDCSAVIAGVVHTAAPEGREESRTIAGTYDDEKGTNVVPIPDQVAIWLARHEAGADLIDLFAEALAVGQAQGKADWQPIDTAPKDALVLLCGRYQNGERLKYPLVGRWHSAYEKWEAFARVTCLMVPTHWMPLPPPPATGAE